MMSEIVGLALQARIGVYSTDLGGYLSIGIYVGLMQVLVWSIARHTSDIDVWRTVAFCLVVGTTTTFGVVAGGWANIGTAMILGVLFGWIVLGYVFELDTWQRVVMTVAGPIAAPLSIFLGYWLKGVIVDGLLS